MKNTLRLALAVLLAGCGGSASSAWDEVAAPSATGGGENVPIQASVRTQGQYEAEMARPASVQAMPGAPPMPQPERADYDYADDAGAIEVDAATAAADGAPPPPPRPQIAQAPNPQANSQDQAQQTATDAIQSPQQLLVYTAGLVIVVHHVEERMDAIESLAREVGGYLGSRAENQITIRVPAQQFDAVMQQLSEGGEVLARRINVVDVGEQYRDMRIRIENLEAMRVRIIRLLERADEVDAALRIEQELNRITLELERLRGQLRHLSSQIAFSTITVTFQPLESLHVERQFQLPFRWLRELGIDRLMRVR